MIKDYDAFISHLKRTGRLKLLPLVLRELKNEKAHEKYAVARMETAEENPALITGWRKIENGVLTDNTAKSALINIYKKVIAT